MSTENVTMQTVSLPSGSAVLGTSIRYHGDGSVSVDVQYSVPKDSSEQTQEPPVSAIIIRDGKPRHNREEAPLRWCGPSTGIQRTLVDQDAPEPRQFYRVLPICFTLDEWQRITKASANFHSPSGGTTCSTHIKLRRIVEALETDNQK